MIILLIQLIAHLSFSPISPYQEKIPPGVQKGKTLMEQRCVKCHTLKTVKDYSPERWEKILPKMSRKAKLSPEENSTLDSYIQWELKRGRGQK